MPNFYFALLLIGIVSLYLGIGIALAGATTVGSFLLLVSFVPLVVGQIGLKLWCNRNK